jgi:hypothetical protein
MFYVIFTELLLKLSFSNKTIEKLEIILWLFPNPFAGNLLAQETVSLLVIRAFL